ncbi:MAG TPA: helicase-related protein, partial [Clostridia bacterium]|nr:helicase-related protein [Clostridia bacterium]
GRGSWRPFQIAFLLMCVQSAARGDAPEDRETVELIWFPTGGGKTEAYLGLAAFAIFYRRLVNILDTGTHALMRYTLRLLTAQQFQRASGLICAMEHLRRSHQEELGTAEFRIGIWLGGDTTPNDRAEALRHYRALVQGREKEDYQFVLLRCPWCGCQIGPLKDPLVDPAKKSKATGKWKKSKPDPSAKHLLGLKQSANTVQLHCPDGQCAFHKALPVYVIDEDIYENPPDLIIGTVDKFAALAWKPEARSIFGIGTDGNRKSSPPGLIIQDELHLITGPLGSMVGLYETVIQDLCTDYRGAKPVLPKIVSSTATTRRYKEQVRGLYARNDVVLFPPPGLDAGDSFFAAYARDDCGSLRKGRAYVGVFAGAYSSGLTTNVKVFSSLLQTPMSMQDTAVDPWYTLLIFHNSLRELGANLTLFQADVPEKLYGLFAERHRKSPPAETKPGNRRYLNDILELTGRISSGEVPLALQELERSATTKLQPKATDVCLASNIIEVGVDVDRLSVMVVNGQPKTTAQYIQVTGRVGRKWAERPGLVVTTYMPNKPRDRSHFERFRTYHERLYAQVEPACVTPFTTPALERALHAVLVAYVRQQGTRPDVDKPSPVPTALLLKIEALVRQRQAAVAPEEANALEQQLARRLNEWSGWGRQEWRNPSDSTDPSLLRYAGSYYPAAWSAVSWATPTSMRNVDAECQPEITLLYAAAAALGAATAVPAARPEPAVLQSPASGEQTAQTGI